MTALSAGLLAACRPRENPAAAAIAFTRIPKADPAGQEQNDIIEGAVTGSRPGQRIVLYARSGKWWLQPLRTNPFTALQNARWTNATHLGSEYAALLVDPGFQPHATYDVLPPAAGAIAAVASVRGQHTSPSLTIPFSGYEWRVRDAPSDRGGRNLYRPANVSIDSAGALHLRVAKDAQDWTCSEVSLTRSLGYGIYRFVVRDIAHLDPSLIFSIFTWDYSGGAQGNREMDIEITRWGDPSNRNAGFVVQPYYVAANVLRFTAPPGRLTHSLRWEPGSAVFRTVRGSRDDGQSPAVAQHAFTAGVPVPGIESIRMNLYIYNGGSRYRGGPGEVVVEHFEYLP